MRSQVVKLSPHLMVAKGTKFWGLHIDNHMNWKKQHIDQILPKLSAAFFVIRKLLTFSKSDYLTNGILC